MACSYPANVVHVAREAVQGVHELVDTRGGEGVGGVERRLLADQAEDRALLRDDGAIGEL